MSALKPLAGHGYPAVRSVGINAGAPTGNGLLIRFNRDSIEDAKLRGHLQLFEKCACNRNQMRDIDFAEIDALKGLCHAGFVLVRLKSKGYRSRQHQYRGQQCKSCHRLDPQWSLLSLFGQLGAVKCVRQIVVAVLRRGRARYIYSMS